MWKIQAKARLIRKTSGAFEWKKSKAKMFLKIIPAELKFSARKNIHAKQTVL